MLSRFRAVRYFLTATLLTIGTACATAPPPPAPPVAVIVSFETKMAWILRLEDQRVLRDPPPPVVPLDLPPTGAPLALAAPPAPSPDLTRLLTDGEARIRRRAALAIGRVGLAEAVPALGRVMASDSDPEVRQMAAFALGLIGDLSAGASLQQALADPLPLVAGRAAEALGLIGDRTAAAAIGKLVAAQVGVAAAIAPDELAYPLDPSAEVFRLALFALVRLNAYDQVAAAVLTPEGQPRVRWWPVAFALQRLQDKRAAPALASLATGEGQYGRAFAVKGLGELKDGAATPLLLSLLTGSERAGPTIEAVRALGQIGDARALQPLLGVLRNSVDPTVRGEVLTAAAASVGLDSTQDFALDLLSDPSPVVRAAALTALSKGEQDVFMTVLSGLEPDAHWSVRAALASLLASVERDRALPRLQQMLTDTDLRVVPSVLTAITKLRAPDAAKVLLAGLQHENAVIRMSAAANLGDLKIASAADALAAAYKSGERDATYVARAAALAALAQLGPAAAIPTLQAALGDKDWAVRRRAAELLRQLDPSAETVLAIRPAPSRPTAAYEGVALVHPPVSPHVYIDTEKGTVEIELAVLDAPLTCEAFVLLARKGFFDGLALHRVVPDFVVQGGDPGGDGEGGPGFTLRDEINQRPFLRGTVGMALDWPDTGGSQFFITYGPQPHLDARYTAFGQVVSGMEVVDRLSQWDAIKRVRVSDGSPPPTP